MKIIMDKFVREQISISVEIVGLKKFNFLMKASIFFIKIAGLFCPVTIKINIVENEQ